MNRALELLAAYERHPQPALLGLLLRELACQLASTQAALKTLTEGVELLTAGVCELRTKAPRY